MRKLIPLIFLLGIINALPLIANAQHSRNKQKTLVAYRNNYQRCNATNTGDCGFEIKNGKLYAWGANNYGQLGIGSTTNQTTEVQVGSAANWVNVSCAQHTLALRSDGTMWSWGLNSAGQLGNGTTTNSSTPAQIGTGITWVSVATGLYHSAAIKADGTLWAWGYNGNGNLGIGSLTDQSSPTQVGTDTKWVSVSAGYMHTLALKADGTLWAWGNSVVGQLGIGTTALVNAPVQVGTATNWISIGVGSYCSWGIKSDGTFWTWGDNSLGQLGIGSTTQQNSPVQVGIGTTWVTAAAGSSFMQAIKSDGTLWGWGDNTGGQLGIGNTTSQTSPVQVGTATNWVDVSAGFKFTVALRADGSIYTAGANASGQLGNGTTTPTTSLGLISTLTNNWLQISTGNVHTAAIRTDGTLWAWGSNSGGILGIGSTVSKTSPVQVGTANNWIAVSAGYNYTLALRADGTLWAWGTNTNGELGIGSNTPQNVPVQVGTGTNWKNISAGYGHSFGIKTDGTIWGWGLNSLGHLGIGSNTAQTSPVQGGTSNLWVSASAGVDHSMAMRADGTIWGTGWNGFGEMGFSGGATSWTQAGTATNWIAVSAGGGHSLGLRSDGTAYGTGWNDQGQLGISSTTNTSTFTSMGSVPSGMTIGISSKWKHTHLLLSDGTVRGAGQNSNYELGDGTVTSRSSPVAATGVTNTATLSSGNANASFDGILKATRTDFCMTGSNTSGQLGDGTTTGHTTYGCIPMTVGPNNVNNGIVMWLNGANVNNTTPASNPANGTSITTWKDVSGAGNDATVLSGQNTPTMNSAQLNGNDIVKFTRTSQILGTIYDVPNIDIRATSMPQTTIFTVYRQGTNVATDWQGIWGNDDGAWDRFFHPHFGSNDGIVSVGPPTNAVTIPNAGIVGATKLLTAVYDNGVTNGSTIYFNGLPVQSVTDNTNPTAAKSTLRIGWDGDDNAFNGDIAEMIVYNRKLSDCEIIAVNKYLGIKFGVTITTAFITPSKKAYICPAGNVTLTASAGVSYQWLLNGAVIPTATSVTYSATAYGKYQVVVGNGSCLDTSEATTVYVSTPTLYVDSSTLVSGSGQSWASPLKSVGEALDITNNVGCASQVWVKKGTYYPMGDELIATHRDSSLRILRNNVKLYGGFAGTETLLSQRNFTTNKTILSGDIGTVGDTTDNSYHIMTIIGNATNNIDSSTIVDGFTFTGAKGEDVGLPTINGVQVYRGAGGAINCAGLGTGNKSSPLLENLIFTRNTAAWGGGVYGEGHNGGISSPMIRSCSFLNNNGTYNGGAAEFYCDGATGNVSPNFVYCTITGNHGNGQAGAAYIASGTTGISSPVFLQCTVEYNYIDPVNDGGHLGGAFYFQGTNATPTLTGCSINYNRAAYGGAMCTAGPLANFTVNNSTFTGNTALQSGGGFVIQGGTITLSNSIFTANKAITGGGLSAFGGSTFTVTNCDFIRDSVTFYGAGLYNVTANLTNITGCRFLNNFGGVVGAIDASTGNINISKTVFFGNKTNELGGVMNNNNATVNFTNCILANNSSITTANAGGGAVHMSPGTTTNFYDCTMSENTSLSTAVPNANTFSIDATATVNLQNSIVWGAAANQVAGAGTATYFYSDIKGVAAAGTNFNRDPVFVNSADPDGADNLWGTTDDGLKLAQCSPLINAGSNALIPGGLTTDITSATRIQQTTVDIGGYESALNNIVVTPSVSILPSPTGTICFGANVQFTATPVNGGGTPAYQWLVNGANVGTSSATYSNATLANGATVQVRMISTVTCPFPDTVFSNTIIMSVNPSPVISSITSTNPTCAGNDGTITINGVTTGTSYTINYSKNTVAQAAVVQVAVAGTLTLTAQSAGSYTNFTVTAAACPSPVFAGPVVLAPPAAPSISVNPVPVVICLGANATYTVTAGGAGLTYQWQVDQGSGFSNISNGVVYSGATTATLTLTTPPVTMNGYNYRVVVTGTCAPAATSTSALLTVNSLPAITTGPSASIICAGSNTSFTVVATGTGLNYQWQADNGSGFNNLTNVAPYSNVTTATLNITAATTGISGTQYRVVVSGTCTPAVISAAVAITVNAAPAITTQPVPSIICAGSNTTFGVVATGTGLTYQWQVNTGSGFTNLTNVAPYSNVTTATMTITAAAAALNGNNYRVVVGGTCVSGVTSNGVLLTINTLPAITTQPVNSTICTGNNTTFSTVATGTALTYQWQANTGSGFNNLTNTAPYSNVTTSTLTVTAATVALNGVTYRVVVTGTCAPPVTSSSAVLNVNIPPAITTQPVVSTICAGTNTSFSVVATGTGLTYQWQVDNGSGFANLFNINGYSNVTTSTLNITGASASLNGYSYRVVITGSCPPAVTSNAVVLTVNAVPAITANPSAVTICAGTNTTFSASATGVGITYQWQVSNGTGYVNIVNGGVYSGATTTALTITGATVSMNGYLYRVIVTGTCAPPATGIGAALTVNPPPAITTQPVDKITCNGTNTTFTVAATGPGLTYQWQEDNGGGFTNLTNTGFYSGTTTVTLTITGTSITMHNNKYRVIVSGTCAPPATSVAATLTVNQVPVITNQSATTKSTCPGDPVVFSITAIGTGISYQWQINTGSGYVNITPSVMYTGITTPVLTIVSPTIPMTGYLYRAVVTGTCAPPAISAPFKLIVYNPVQIASQMTSDTACGGWTTQLGLRASGGGLFYQWQKKTPTGYVDVFNVPPFSGAQTDSLRIVDIPDSLDGSVYRCKVTETVLCNITIYSDDIPLSVRLTPKISPDKIVAPFFGTAVFDMITTGSIFQWQENQNKGGGFTDLVESPKYTGVTTNKLTITPLGFDMSGYKYRCIVSGICYPMVSSVGVITVDPALSVKGVVQNGIHTVSIFPNPTSAVLNFRFDTQIKGNTVVSVLNKIGQVVYTGLVDLSQSNTGSINVDNLASGVYTLQVINEKEGINTVSLFTKQ